MALAVARTSSERSVTSRRFPSGVATRYNERGMGRKGADTVCSVGAASFAFPDSRPAPSTPVLAFMSVSFAASHPGRALIGPTRWLNLVWLIRLAVASLAVAAAFSAAQAPAASDAVPAAEGGVRRPPANPPVEIAIVLPLDAPPYARAAEALRAGFTPAAEASRGPTPFLVIPHP